jgi:hypothetical protein
MRKIFVFTALLLTMATGLTWSAPVPAPSADLTSQAPVLTPDGTQGAMFMPKPTPAAACTVSCWTDPTITCTSQTGNCSTGGFWGVYWITCDGVRRMCPEF